MVVTIAHRGAGGILDQNTLQSVENAVESGADMVEVDVYRCGTGEPVVIHYSRLEFTTSGFGFVQRAPLDKLKQVDAGDGAGVPTLAEVLDTIDGRAGIHIELKRSAAAEPVAKVLEEYIAAGSLSTDDVLVSSFFPPALNAFRELMPEVRTGVCLLGLRADYRLMDRLTDADVVLPHWAAVTENFVKQAHADGYEVYAWALFQRPVDIDRLLDMGIDGIEVNYPDRILA